MASIGPGEPIRISASTFMSYLDCPESAMARLRGEYGPESVAAFRGGLAHRIFAKHLAEGPIDVQQFNQICKQEIGGSNSLNNKVAALKLKMSEIDGVIAEAQALYERFKAFPSDGFSGAEIAIEHDAGDGVTLFGAVDARFDDDDGVRLVDWKTGDLGDPMPQLHFYTALWALEYQVLPVRVEAVSVKTGERQAEQPSREQTEHVIAEIGRFAAAARESWSTGAELARNGGPKCRWCPLLDECAEGRVAAEMLDLSSP